MGGDVVLAEKVSINAGNSGPGKGTLELPINFGVYNTTIHLRKTGSSIDSTSVLVNIVSPSLAITAPASAENWTYYNNPINTVAWNYNGNPDDIVTIYMAFNGQDQIMGKTTAGTGSFQISKQELIHNTPFKIRIETPYSSDQTVFNITIHD
jgi:hypothetical protein